MTRNGIASSLLCLSLLVVSSCTDNTIEGASTTTSGFVVNKISATNGTVNTGTCNSGGATPKNGTTFTVTIDYAGTEQITGIKLIYKFSGGTASAPVTLTTSEYKDTPATSSGTFRGVSGAGNVKITSCVNFGTATTIQYDYTLTMKSLKTYPATITITKPAGAN
jgi:hypothetical protein